MKDKPEDLMLNLIDHYFERLDKIARTLGDVCLDLAVLSREISGTFHIEKKGNKK
jgi:hypothetical protein|tara:strand:- start:401 stop:565 length:165 start_codon:yes stop_codon:yes gene_type:complete